MQSDWNSGLFQLPVTMSSTKGVGERVGAMCILLLSKMQFLGLPAFCSIIVWFSVSIISANWPRKVARQS
jgi:hypothetical protein